MNKAYLIAAILTLNAGPVSAANEPTGLLCELLEAPEKASIADARPEFGWIVHSDKAGDVQTSYQIVVQTTGGGLVWDSGKVDSADSINVEYAGKDLAPDGGYSWKVRTWTRLAGASDWSQTQTLRTSGALKGYATSRYPLAETPVAPAKITRKGDGHYLIDFGRVAFGYLVLNINTPTAGALEVQLAERGTPDGVNRNPGGTVRYVEVKQALKPGLHRYRVETPADGRNTGGKAIRLPQEVGVIMPFRYVEVMNCPVTLDPSMVSQVAVHYPFNDQDARFESSDETLDQIWELCRYSMKATSFCGVYVDGDRERIPYEADAYINQLSHYAVDREFSLARHSHEYLLEHSTWPTEWKQHSVMMAWADFMYSGNKESLAACFDLLKSEKTLEQRVRPDGLLDTKGLRDIVDWPAGERDGYDFRDVNTVVNAFHYENLKQMAQLAEALGKQDDAKRYRALAQQFHQVFNAKLFDPKQGVYVDGEGTHHASLHANMLPLAFGLVPDERIKTVADFVVSKGMACSVYAAQYLMEGLYQAGRADEAFALLTSRDIRSWYNMIRVGSTITLEAWDNRFKPNQDWNHAWGAVPGNIIPRYLLGVRPLEPGFAKVLIRPMPGPLERAKATIPSIRGPIRVAIGNAPDKPFLLDVSIPVNMSARVEIPLPGGTGGVTLDGKPVQAKIINGYAIVDEVGSGTHSFRSTAVVKQREKSGKSVTEADFRNPPPGAGIRAFWWWLNGNVSKEAITRDLEEMKAKGFNGALIFDADGSSQQGNRQVPAGPLFGGPEWTALFVHACKEAKRLDLELSLNIQSGWNLGGPKVSEEEATQQLVWSKTTVKGPATMEQVLRAPAKSGGFYRDIAVIAVPGAPRMRPVEDLPLKSSTRELGMSAPDCRFLLETSSALPGEVPVKSADILKLTAKVAADGTLRWQVPAGEWEVLRIGHSATNAHVSTQSAGWGGRVLDYLNPASLDAYWNRNIEPLCKAIGPLAGTTLRYIHTDSWEGGGMNWTPGFERIFRENRGYDPLPWLAVLAGHVIDSREDSNAFLADFRKTIGDLVANHYGELAALAKKHGMGTQPECSGPHAGPLDGLKNYGRSELMMSEFWSPSPHRPTPPNRFFVKQAASAAHTYGKRLVGAEAFTTIGPHWNDVPWSAMKPSFDHEFCSGLNLVFNHTFTCSPKEMGLPGQEYFAGTHFNPQVTWWNEAPAVIDYFRRCQVLAQQGDFVADLVYYYGDHIPNIATLKESDPAGAMPGYDYDLLSEELLLSSLTVRDDRLTLPSGMLYRVLVLPDHGVLSLGALEKVDALVRAGASVLGPKALRAVSLEGGAKGKELFRMLADGLWGTETHAKGAKGTRQLGKGRIAWGMTSREFLHTDKVAPDVVLTLADGSTAPGMDWIHYRINDAEVYFMAELAGTARTIDATFRVDDRIPELWNAVDGSIRDANTFTCTDGRTRLPLALDPYDSLFVVFRKRTAEGGRNRGPNLPPWREAQAIPGPWDVTFDPKWGGPGKPVRFDTLTDWLKHENPGIRYYSGKAVYRTTFEIADDLANKPLALELGMVKDVGIARVTLNGTDLGIVWRSPFRVDLGKVVKPGENTLEVMVVNSWHNRLIGDRDLPADKRLTMTNITVVESGKRKWQAEPSGLLGPVRIMIRNNEPTKR
ncbi:MAG: hypothetical protein K9N23_07255 [Akkermansiaceae bacterium]|nr:hypothetical protein [Akkermansiaceae bacterium]